jgi:hypothetical protein
MPRTRLILPILLAVAGRAGAAAPPAWPAAGAVEAQPLLAQVKRVGQALDHLGQPLPPDTRAALDALRADGGDGAVAAAVQSRLDPLCLAAVEVGPAGVTRVTPRTGPAALVEQGWRAFLVKVVNPAGATGVLRPESANARPVPNGPKAAVAERWLGLLPYTGQPLLPNLSGLGLEYTVLQVYARDPGEKTAAVSFAVEGGARPKTAKPGPTIREWRFASGADGWVAGKDCTAEAAGGSLNVAVAGGDPILTAPVTAKRGEFVLRFWATFDKPGVGEFFWWTEEQRQPDGSRKKAFQIEPGRGVEYEVRFAADDVLAGIRIDPGSEPGRVTFDWVTLSYETDPEGPGPVDLRFAVAPAVPVTFRVTEADGTPATARFTIRDEDGRVYPAQAKRLAPDFFFQKQVYRATGEQVRLPAGRYTVECSRGPETVPETKELVVGDTPVTLTYEVKRWIDPSARGWWSGDHHIHAAGCLHYENPTEGVDPPDMIRHTQGEDVKVGCCLTWGPCFDYQKRFFTGRPDPVSRPPYLLRYDVEVSGFGSHQSGHLNLLRLTDQIPPGGGSKDHWPTLGMNTLRWAKKQGAVCGPAHSSIGLQRFVGRVPGAADGPNELPHYNVPAYDGIGANEFVVDVTHEVPGPDGKPVPAVDFISTMNTDRLAEFTMWYHVLNCGFRVRASGETDFPCMSGERVGIGRVYVKTDGPLDFDTWVRGVADGRSYVSDGLTHLMDFTATAGGRTLDVGTRGSELPLAEPGRVSVAVRAAARYPDKKTVPVELVVNGLPVARKDLPCDGTARDLTFDADISASSWVAVRVYPTGHTNPVFVPVGGKPVRASRHSAEWCLAGVDQCWRMKKGTYRADELRQAEEDYDHARRVYRKVRDESPN